MDAKPFLVDANENLRGPYLLAKQQTKFRLIARNVGAKNEMIPGGPLMRFQLPKRIDATIDVDPRRE